MKLLADATLPYIHALFGQSFTVTAYHHEDDLNHHIKTHDILVCRATTKVNQTLLDNTPIQCVATATSGLDHIDCAYLKSREIACLDAKGANAQAVADYVLATLAWLLRNQDLKNKQAGIIGAGAVGTQVARRLDAIGYTVCCYDPPKALKEPAFKSASLDDLTQCDILCIHANLHDALAYPTYHLIDENFIRSLKHNIVIINASRGDVVCERDIIQSRHPFVYCTDVFSNEPTINAKLVAKATLCTPHIAGHTFEAKQNAVSILYQKLMTHFQRTAITQWRPDPFKIPLLDCASSQWEDYVLKIYDPSVESNVLKVAKDLPTQFLALRKRHRRHHLSAYAPQLSELNVNFPLSFF